KCRYTGDIKASNAARLSAGVVGSRTTPIRRVQGSSSTTSIGPFEVIEECRCMLSSVRMLERANLTSLSKPNCIKMGSYGGAMGSYFAIRGEMEMRERRKRIDPASDGDPTRQGHFACSILAGSANAFI